MASRIIVLRYLFSVSSWKSLIYFAEQTKFQKNYNISWSQGGEDLALIRVFRNVPAGNYIDVGAHNPFRFSNTRLLYELGWRGINVEANGELMRAFHVHRKDEVNMNFAVGCKKSYNFTFFKETALSTGNPEWAKTFSNSNWKISHQQVIEGIKLRTIYDTHFPQKAVELICIDAEGMDHDVLLSLEMDNLDEDRFPRYLLLETKPPVYASLEEPSVKLAMKYGYVPVVVLPMSTILKFQPTEFTP